VVDDFALMVSLMKSEGTPSFDNKKVVFGLIAPSALQQRPLRLILEIEVVSQSKDHVVISLFSGLSYNHLI
jgi:hypothetical protein